MKNWTESDHKILGQAEWRRVIDLSRIVICQVWVGDEWRSLITMDRHDDWKQWLEGA